MDFLITTLSLIRPVNFREGFYCHPQRIRDEDGRIRYQMRDQKDLKGYFTNEAPAKYLS